MTVKRDKFKFTAMRTNLHGIAKGWNDVGDYFIDIIYLAFSGIKSMYDFFIVVCKDSS